VISRKDTKAQKDRLMTEVPRDVEEIARVAVDAAYRLHRDVGPGLLEHVYEAVLAEQLRRKGYQVDRQKPIDIEVGGVRVAEAFRADLVINDKLLLELKSVERLAPVHAKQVITYLRLMNLPLGLLINFNTATFKEGVKRLINTHPLRGFASLRETNIPPSRGDGRR
jgi:GxxExxY protein